MLLLYDPYYRLLKLFIFDFLSYFFKMLKIPIGKGRFYDLLHKGAVWVCVVGTLLAFVNTGAVYSSIISQRKTKEPTGDEELEVISSGEETQKL